MAQLDGFKTETVRLDDLKPHPRNYRTHPEDQIEHLVESIREHGLYRNIVCAREGTLLAGHGVWEALKRLGWEEAPVVRMPLDPDDPRALKLLAGDNEVEHLGMRDDRALSELLKEIKDADSVGLLGTGYDDMMLSALVYVTRPTSEIADFDEAAHWVGMPEYDAGTLLFRLNISFSTEEDRDDLLDKLGISTSNMKHRGKNNVSMWWPPQRDDDRKSVRFEVWGDGNDA